ncbi:MAG: hypothetical protein JWN67_4227 [Actinomycetia bacterium]|nr:hypothetical protein [Actinomycetes bacterium]
MTAAANERTGVPNPSADVLAVELTRVRRALTARFGTEVGQEAAADVAAWAWQHLDEVVAARNPGGLLYRVGQSKARAHRRWASRRSRFDGTPIPGGSDGLTVEESYRGALGCD